jgi:LmbE family N-acetylglucosaminyl deacetylase
MKPAPSETLARATASPHAAGRCPAAVLVFAHPDDETVALGGRLGRFGKAHLVHVTDGAPRNQYDCLAHGFDSLSAYRAARRAELDSALAAAGVPCLSRECLDIPDQEASLELTRLTRQLAGIFRKRRPVVVFTHPYEGGHPDHDACAFAVHHAAALIEASNQQAPLIIEAPFYHASAHGIETGTFLPAPVPIEEKVYLLSAEEQQRKQTLLACFTSQRETLSVFQAREERYRIAPAYEFRRPPHAAQAFSNLAWEAEDTLNLEKQTVCG